MTRQFSLAAASPLWPSAPKTGLIHHAFHLLQHSGGGGHCNPYDLLSAAFGEVKSANRYAKTLLVNIMSLY